MCWAFCLTSMQQETVFLLLIIILFTEQVRKHVSELQMCCGWTELCELFSCFLNVKLLLSLVVMPQDTTAFMRPLLSAFAKAFSLPKNDVNDHTATLGARTMQPFTY